MFSFVRIWIWICALATSSGWILSAVAQLNRAGYAIFFAFAALVFFGRAAWRRRRDGRHLSGGSPVRPFYQRWKIFSRRFRRPLPLMFAGLAALVFAGGIIHLPDNYTGLGYRVGRVLQWLAHDQWFWVHTENYRMNDRACGFEWLAVPVLCFTHSIRPLFLLNFIPFLMLPGLVFNVFLALGIRRRVAWQWMWLLPTGYNFLLQAGSIANDAFPTVYGLAAMAFALRARKTGRPGDLWLSILAIALLTGAKASNLPLLLPWFIAVFPAVTVLRRHAVTTVAVMVIAVAVSFVPTAILNVRHCGDWSGAALEPAVMTVKNPLAAAVGNVFQLLLDNFWPPFSPFAAAWNQHAPERLPQFLTTISERFNNGIFHVGELPTEDWAGLGAGVCGLLLVCLGAHWFGRGRLPVKRVSTILIWSPWLALSVYCAKSGMDTAARLISPYYPLLLPALLAGISGAIFRSRLWRVLVGFHLVLAAAVVILTPDRPLWPAQTVLSKLSAQHPDVRLVSRAHEVYAIYAERADSLARVRELLPAGANVIGFAGDPDDCDFSLWLPLGSRRVEHFLLSDTPEAVRARRFDVVVLGGNNLNLRQVALDDWLKTMNAEVIGSTNITLKVSEGPRPWHVVRLR